MAHIVPAKALPANTPAMAGSRLTLCHPFPFFAFFPEDRESRGMASREDMGKHHADFHGDVAGILCRLRQGK